MAAGDDPVAGARGEPLDPDLQVVTDLRAALAAALATLQILEREGKENAATVGASMLERMQTWPAKYPQVGEARGRGLMLAVEFVGDQKSKKPASALRDRIVDLAFERGLLLLGFCFGLGLLALLVRRATRPIRRGRLVWLSALPTGGRR